MTPKFFIGFKLCSELKPYREIFQMIGLSEISHNEGVYVVYSLEALPFQQISTVVDTFKRLDESLQEYRHLIPKRLTILQLFCQLYIG